MNIIVPSYYKYFNCIANKCTHNCCIGWEIDIDDITLSKYKELKDYNIGFSRKISLEGGTHFILDSNKRCPFLNSDNLCDIILHYGNDMLCQICNDHPRFRNFYSNRVEIGLGLCCEAACKLILAYKEKVVLSHDTDNSKLKSEKDFFIIREQLFKILQNRKVSIDKRIENMLNLFKIKFNFAGLADKYMQLERLDNTWDSYLKRIEYVSKDIVLPDKWQISFEQIAVYFVYRHLSLALENERYDKLIHFIAESYYTIKLIFLKGAVQTLEELIEISRLYSSEIEYSDQNIYALLDME